MMGRMQSEEKWVQEPVMAFQKQTLPLHHFIRGMLVTM
jgi:hypothetical protein